MATQASKRMVYPHTHGNRCARHVCRIVHSICVCAPTACTLETAQWLRATALPRPALASAMRAEAVADSQTLSQQQAHARFLAAGRQPRARHHQLAAAQLLGHPAGAAAVVVGELGVPNSHHLHTHVWEVVLVGGVGSGGGGCGGGGWCTHTCKAASGGGGGAQKGGGGCHQGMPWSSHGHSRQSTCSEKQVCCTHHDWPAAHLLHHNPAHTRARAHLEQPLHEVQL